MPVTPMKIRTLQRKLYAKAKQEPGYRFYALSDKVYRADLLQHAWRLVKSNRGAPGIDGVSFADIEAEEAEPVNDYETLMRVIYWAFPPVVGGSGGLIQTAWGSAPGLGAP